MTQQGNNMKERSARRFEPATLNKTVLVPLSSVDKAKLEAFNLLAVVLEVTKDGKQYKLGTKSGVLDGFCHRNQFQVFLVHF